LNESFFSREGKRVASLVWRYRPSQLLAGGALKRWTRGPRKRRSVDPTTARPDASTYRDTQDRPGSPRPLASPSWPAISQLARST